MPHRVLILTPSLDYGGAEVVIVNLAKSLRATGWDVCAVSMLPPKAFVEDLKAAGVSVASLDMSPRRLNLSGIFSLLRFLRAYRPEVIHAHMFHANILARLLRPILRIPVVCTVQNILESSRQRDSARLRNWAYRLTDWSCDCTTAVAETVRRHYVGARLASASMRMIPNPVDIARFRPKGLCREQLRAKFGWGAEFVWLAVGRLELAKDYPNLFNAFASLQRRGSRSRLVIAGDGRLRSQLEHLASSLGLSVSFLGTRTDIPDLMQASDAYVMSSAWEGAPVALMEACASALPVVATDAGGNAEIVKHGATGYLIPTRDSDALADALHTLENSSADVRRSMGLAGRAYVESHYAPGPVFSSYESLYREVIGA